jgi:ubiquinone/menaquinone biosynthesis C-methylase UbiE
MSQDVWKNLTLDVGCGANPKGDVNGDLFIGYTPHNITISINPKKTKNFVKLDAHFLPFKDKAFVKTFSFHCLEHLEHPLSALKEMRRVTREHLIIKVPCWHFYIYVIDFISLFKCFFGLPLVKTTKYFFDTLKRCSCLNETYSTHLWYVYFSNADDIKTTKKYVIPYEHEFTFLP